MPKKSLLAGALSLLVGTACPTLAQTQSGEGEASLVLEEILVTASRRVENLQEVAMSVSAFNSDFFKETGVNQLTDLEQYTPNLKINSSTSKTIPQKAKG